MGGLGSLAKILVPFGEVGGSYLQQTGAAQDAAARKAQADAGLAELVKNLGPGYQGFSKAIAMGVNPDTAVKLIGIGNDNTTRTTFARMLTESGGKMTPDVVGYGVANGLIDPKELPKLLNPTATLPAGFVTDLAKKGLTPDAWNAMTPAAKAALFPAPTKNPPPTYWRTEMAPDGSGRSVQVPYYTDPVTGQEKRRQFADSSAESIPSAPNANEKKLADSINTIEAQMPQLKGQISALGDVTPSKLGQEYAKYRAPFGMLGPVDPRYSAYFNALGQIQTDLVGAATAGGSRSYQLIDMLKPHIPSPTDPPERALEKLNGFDSGRFAAMKATMFGGTQMSDPRAKASDFTPPKPPFALSSDPDAVQKDADGNYWVKDTKGLHYKYDAVRGAWLPQ